MGFVLLMLVAFGSLLIWLFANSTNKQAKKPPQSSSPNGWWSKKRLTYNKGLVVAGFTAFILYAVLGGWLVAPHVDDFEITIFTIAFQGAGYLLMMLVANVFYSLGEVFDGIFNQNNSDRYRNRLFNLGFGFSVGLPFLIPMGIVVQYFVLYANGN